ncbi:hypothetical protein ACQ4PT_053226 [Festuca glaucescens]
MAYKFHAWLALRRRCWTADRLARHGLPSHALCPLCGTQPETLDHLSLTCPYAVAVWGGVTLVAGIPLQPPTDCLGDWWSQVVGALPDRSRKDANSLILLVLRSLWLERNARIFDNKERTDRDTVRSILDVWGTWVACRGRQVRDVH